MAFTPPYLYFKKDAEASFLRGFRSTTRLGCPPLAGNSTHAPRKVFFPRTRRGKNDLILFRRCGGETPAEGLLTGNGSFCAPVAMRASCAPLSFGFT